MKKNWIASLCIEHREARVIQEQAKYGWLLDVQPCKRHVYFLREMMIQIDSKLRPELPKLTKQYGVTVEEPFKMDGSPKKMVTDWGLEEVDGPFTRVYFEDMNLGSDVQLKEYLLSVGWKPTLWNFRKKDTKNGKKGEITGPKISHYGKLCENLAKIEGDLPKYIVQYLRAKHRKGLLEGLLRVVRPDGRVSGEANTIGAATHRMTHSKIVNIPGADAWYGKQIRSLFIAKEGYSIIGCDSKSNQLRMLAHYLNIDEKHPYGYAILYGTKRENNDAHCVAANLAGLSKRHEGKTLNYSLLFGQGDKATGEKLGETTAGVKRIKKEFFGNIPELPRLLRAVKARVSRVGYLHGLDGRKIYVGSEHKALNYLLQSAEAIYMKYAQCILWKRIRLERLDAHFVATVHDEFQLEVLDEHTQRVKELALDSMLVAGRVLGITIPMEGDAAIGRNWYQTH